eukprot:CAMPEP_0179014522 /NCGR_PEP_ID=MMETSP0796-20121207/2298_1 /TAXON_ID=73915 /ORGANISM="Pyrodinium bahamense, Strain pbaha01" /LENGTH=42 /DNA_ID= /DNA_START= /DNA_END= /DNA_ORIENTATION=
MGACAYLVPTVKCEKNKFTTPRHRLAESKAGGRLFEAAACIG